MMWPPPAEAGFDPVATVLGTFWGRDCIYLDGHRFDLETSTLVLVGEVNGKLCVPMAAAEWVGYEIRFLSVVRHVIYDVDDPRAPRRGPSSFCRDISAQLDSPLRRYVFSTYDDVFEIDCVSFVLVSGSMLDAERHPVVPP
jgi:hypothetical protein